MFIFFILKSKKKCCRENQSLWLSDSNLFGSLAFNEEDKLNFSLILPSGASLHGKSVEPCLRLIRLSIIRKWTQMEQNINMTCDA